MAYGGEQGTKRHVLMTMIIKWSSLCATATDDNYGMAVVEVVVKVGQDRFHHQHGCWLMAMIMESELT